jgi:hypothetical protein
MADEESGEANSIGDLVEAIQDIAKRDEEVAIGDLVRQFGTRSFAPFILILALIGITPVGTIPTVPTLIAMCIILVAGQMAVGRTHIWLPGFVKERSVDSEKLREGEGVLYRIAETLDRMAKARLTALASGTALRIVAVLIVMLCCAIPILELVPFAAAGPFLAIALLALAMMVKDGLVMLLGALLALGALIYGGTSIAW